MSDAMNFPNSPEEFIEQHSFKDKEEVYTNGSELIQVFRVHQMLEHYTRKSMERIIDKIEDMKDDCLKEYNKYLDGEDLRKVILLGEAIEIVKEEGGIE